MTSLYAGKPTILTHHSTFMEGNMTSYRLIISDRLSVGTKHTVVSIEGTTGEELAQAKAALNSILSLNGSTVDRFPSVEFNLGTLQFHVIREGMSQAETKNAPTFEAGVQ